ncbi:MAG TPA: FixH family protein [Burkholderiales bacterium]
MRWLLGLTMVLSFEAVAQKAEARLDCIHTGKDFIYDCVIEIQRQGLPLTDLDVRMSADMPSMPMAHQVKPVRADATSTPGEYRARLDLEMGGEWAVKLRLAGPVRDQLVLHYEFDERGARPVRGSGKPPRK